MTTWQDFNDAEQQQGFDLIPRGTLVPVRMTLKPGGHDEPGQGWDGGYATQSYETGAIYLAVEFVITGGPHAKRKLWSNIGLHSEKGPAWGQMGRSFIRAALNSARGVHPEDHSPPAVAARRIEGFHELDGLEFIARVDVEKDSRDQDRNIVKYAVEPDHPEYARLRGTAAPVAPAAAARPAPAATAASTPARPAATPAAATPRGKLPTKPAWAQ